MNNVTSTRTRLIDRERRSRKRLTTVLRVGLLSDGERVSFCVVKNISSSGVQVRAYVPLNMGDPVQLCVGDGNPLKGHVVWKRGQLVGIKFERSLDPCILLRTTHNDAGFRRRSSPRVKAAARATLRTGGRTFAAELCDISTIGTRLQTRKPIAKGCPALLKLPDLPTIRGYVRWSEGQLSGFMFETPLPVPTLAQWVSQRMRVDHDLCGLDEGKDLASETVVRLDRRSADRPQQFDAGTFGKQDAPESIRALRHS